jgi:hypothetical protein
MLSMQLLLVLLSMQLLFVLLVCLFLLRRQLEGWDTTDNPHAGLLLLLAVLPQCCFIAG